MSTNEKKRILRVMFKIFDENLESRIDLSWQIKMILAYVKYFTIPSGYNGFKYDHVEIVTPDKERFSIRMETTTKKAGVYLISKDGLNDKNKDVIFSENNFFKIDPHRYKLFFAFVLDGNQETVLKAFIKNHVGDSYNFGKVNLNVALRKVQKLGLISEKCRNALFINDYKRYAQRGIKPEWDCVTLISRCLREVGIISCDDSDILGLSTFDFAKILLQLSRNNAFGQSLSYVVSKELDTEFKLNQYDKKIEAEYEFGTRLNVDFDKLQRKFGHRHDLELEEDTDDPKAKLIKKGTVSEVF